MGPSSIRKLWAVQALGLVPGYFYFTIVTVNSVLNSLTGVAYRRGDDKKLGG